MKAIIEKIKEYKIIVICAGLGLALGGFFLLKPSTQKPSQKQICRLKLQLFQRIHHLKRNQEGRKG